MIGLIIGVIVFCRAADNQGGQIQNSAQSSSEASVGIIDRIRKAISKSSNDFIHGVYIGNDTTDMDVVIRAEVPDNLRRAPFDNTDGNELAEADMRTYWKDQSKHSYYFFAGGATVHGFYPWMTATQAKCMYDRVKKAIDAGKKVLFGRESDDHRMGEIVFFHYLIQKTGLSRAEVIAQYPRYKEGPYRFPNYQGSGTLEELCPKNLAELQKTT